MSAERSTTPPPRVSRRAAILAGAGLVLAALAVYANSFSGPFIFDDFLSIPQNPTIRNLFTAFAPPGGGVTVTGRPVLNLSFALNYALSDDHVWIYHVLNLLIHALAGLVLFGIVRRTLGLVGLIHADERAGQVRSTPPQSVAVAFRGATPPSQATLLAFAVALLWLVHPLQTESVTYLVQRAESLMGLFYLLTLYGFIRGAETGRTGWWFTLSFVSCLLGMATKEVMVSAPVIVFLYDRTFLAGSFRAAWRRRGRVHLALASTWILLAALVLHASNRGGSAGFGAGVSFPAYAATQFQALSHYLWLSVWPHPLIIDYGAQLTGSVGEVARYAVVIVLLVAATLVALVRWPAFGFLGAFFFAILAPTSLVPVVRQTLAEHRMYLALAPVLVLLVLALHAALGRRARFVWGAAAIGLGWLTIQRNLVYRSSAAIWRDTVAERPGNPAAHNNYGNLLAQAGQPAAALVQFEEAIRLDPGYADASYNAGKTLMQLHRLPEAIARFEQALRSNANLPDAQTMLGLALVATGRADEAITHDEQALRLDPNYAPAHEALGRALATTGRLPEAIAQFEQALKINPAVPEVHGDLGMALVMAGRVQDGIAQFKEALQLDPNLPQVHLDLALTLENIGRPAEAAPHFEAARRLGLTLPPPRN